MLSGYVIAHVYKIHEQNIIIILYVECTYELFIRCIEFHVACMQSKLCRICRPALRRTHVCGDIIFRK